MISDIEYPERSRLKIMEKVPQFPPGMRPPKMQKRLRYMRGPEEVHNFLMYRQYGIIVSLYTLELCILLYLVTRKTCRDILIFFILFIFLNYRLQEEVD